MMTTLADEFQRIRSAGEALPDESQCPVCGFFDITHPDVRRILIDRDSQVGSLSAARCRYSGRDELARRDSELREQEAGLPAGPHGPRTFENFIIRQGTESMIEAAGKFMRREGPRLLTIVGNTGCGKSHILEAIGRASLAQKRTVRYDVAARFLDRLRHTYSADRARTDWAHDPEDGDVHDLLAWYNSQNILIIDDIGYEKPSTWVVEKLTTLIDTRLETAGWTVIATNLDDQTMEQNLGMRLSSRLFATNRDEGSASVVVCTAKDYRKGT
jgi:DNA replication protein DnaC